MHRNLPHPIRAARTAQQHAVRAIAARGLAHPITHALLAAAALAAAGAWEAGHRVTDLHPSPSREGTELEGRRA
ncbi:hypothetical protein [Streptomyces agglomeratus]|uniref:hypothetical protein n=1 Tax=Streptomyces agglomeratus TaxID=285458 RepID=UPI000854C57F|nr:hypothetical protein [Streptomyces agglomeratus]OEJ36327.1 hypothetical protein BGK72_38875 [Streptomyces agglomeratus]